MNPGDEIFFWIVRDVRRKKPFQTDRKMTEKAARDTYIEVISKVEGSGEIVPPLEDKPRQYFSPWR